MTETTEAAMKRKLTAAERKKLDQQIDTWQKELVNLTRRNRLLYFKHTKSATLEIASPHVDTVWKGLSGGWEFYVPPEDKRDEEDEADGTRPEPARGRHPNELVTDKMNPAELTRSLRNLERKASQAYIDTGLKVLYLCFQMLRWVDPKDGKPVESPVLLYPVDLVRESLQSTVRLVPADGDPIINPSLVIKMETEFGLDLDLTGDSEDLDPDRVRSAIEAAIRKEPEWQLEDRVVLGTFTFHREAMYQDLVANAAKAAEEPLVQALAIGPAAAQAHDFGFDPVAEAEMDSRAPAESLVSIGDADSTQRACIVAARDGKSFVMDGPPGTGKSQTITNMIAELLHAGKSVLFVSEKAAALDVVANRLRSVGLDEFVLELHSHKATRKEVAQTLGAALASRPAARSKFGAQELNDLQRTREALNQYAIALNEVRVPLDRSLHQVLGRIVSLKHVPSLPAASINHDELSANRLGEIVSAAGELERAWGPVARGDEFLWKHMRFPVVSSGMRRDIESKIDLALTELLAVSEQVDAIDYDLGLNWPRTLLDADRLLHLLQTLESFEDRAKIPAAWLSSADLESVRGAHRAGRAAYERLETASTRAQAIIPDRWKQTPDRLSKDLDEIDDLLAELQPPIQPLADQPEWPAHATAVLSEAQAVGRALLEHATVVDEAFGLRARPGTLTASGLGDIAELATMVDSTARPEPSWLNPVVQSALTEAETVLTALVNGYRERRDKINGVFKPSVLEIDVASLKDRMQQRGAFGRMSGAHRADKKLLAPHVVSGKVKSTTIAALDEALEWQELSKTLDDAESQHAGTLGSYYPDRETADLNRLNNALSQARRALALTGSETPARLAEQIALDGNPSAEALAAGNQIRELLARWEAISPSLRELSADIDTAPIGDFVEWVAHANTAVGHIVETQESANVATGTRLALGPLRDLATALDEVRQQEHEIEVHADEWAEQLGDFVSESPEGFDRALTAIHWTEMVRSELGGPVTMPEATRVLSLPPHAEPLRSVVSASQVSRSTVLDLFESTQRVRLAADFDVSFDDAIALLEDMRASTADMEEWNRHAGATSTLSAHGLAEQVSALVAAAPEPEVVSDAIERATLEAWADSLIESDDDLKPISSVERDNLTESFKALDRAQVAGAAAKVINACSANRPNTLAGAAGTIQREAEKKTRHMPIKMLLDSTREVALKLKPCFMMSPLTVSQFLPTDLVFDAVIFDEASQVKPSEAVNCLYRARQVVVAGDPRQLPPTSFFETGSGSDLDEYDEEAVEDFESVLDGFRSSGVPMMPLSWHYRSQHESLITFSNYQFYDGRLHTFPGAIDTAHDVGVEFIAADGVYRRGAGRDNPIEARKVVERVIFHLENHPRLTMGVVAFSGAQESAIAIEIERQAEEHPELNELLNADRLDGFFVKNLENVQGDERDIIIFSIGYGKDEAGKFTETMGPLNRQGGERRLNVAITRARRRVEVVSSVTAGDFPGTSAARGVRELQRYLAFAQNGISALSVELGPNDADVESPFEEEVFRTIRDMGFDAQPQVGVAGYRIDLGVRNPAKPGEFVLAVECDGAAYHSSRVARDRDRLRQQVIESLGWSVHRIWGPSWYRDRAAEERRLRDAIEGAIAVGHTAPPRRSATFEAPIEVVYEEASLDERPEWVTEYEVTDRDGFWAIDPNEFADVGYRTDIAHAINQIVETEGPIDKELVRQRTMECFGLRRMGSRIRSAYDDAFGLAVKSHGLRIVSRSVVTKDSITDRVRVPSDDPETMRKVAMIPPSEQRMAISMLVTDAIRIDRSELIQRFSRLFGWQRSGADIQRSFDHQLSELLADGTLHADRQVISLGQA